MYQPLSKALMVLHFVSLLKRKPMKHAQKRKGKGNGVTILKKKGCLDEGVWVTVSVFVAVDRQQRSGALLTSLAAIGGHLRPLAVIGGHWWPLAAIDACRPLVAIVRPLEAIGGHWRPSMPVGSHWWPLVAIGGH